MSSFGGPHRHVLITKNKHSSKVGCDPAAQLTSIRATMLLTELPAIDDVLSAHRSVLGRDFTPYRNHVYRVTNLCARLAQADEMMREKIAIAAVFHDLGIWTDGTFDYIEPSVKLANAYLPAVGHSDWVAEIAMMIREHHKITQYQTVECPFVEPFRRADWIDVTLGVRSFGVPRSFVRQLYSVWPDEGFHWRLVQFAITRLRSHPLTPLPMVKW